MKALLVRIGVDQAFGRWNAPVDADGRFVYVPIPEKPETKFHPGLERRYGEVLPSLHRFCERHGRELFRDLRFPKQLLQSAMHLDPDFECLTYGDDGGRRGAEMVDMKSGDLLVFYGGMRPIHQCDHKLIYALMGILVVEEVLKVNEVPERLWHENAHVRKTKRGQEDIVVRARVGASGRFERCIPIGAWRNRSYRVRQDLLDKWGGLSVRDGFIQRSVRPPSFTDPKRFLKWFRAQRIRLMERNN